VRRFTLAVPPQAYRVAIGLLWSVAVMSKWVPVASAEMISATVIPPYEAGRHEAAQ